MDTNDKQLGELFEALSIERLEVPALTPPFQGFGDRPVWWCYFGKQWQVHTNKIKKCNYDIEYRNAEGKRHRLYGPAYISIIYNIQEWYKDGVRHREDGPAYIHNNNQVWFYEGKLHRLDGPAVIEGGGPKQYWIHGQKMCYREYKKEIARRKRKGLIK